MDKELQDRITELEIRFSHQSLLVEELNEVVADCNLRIAQVQKENLRLREMLKSLSPGLEESPDE